ncbi:MAG: hypothetical protein OEN02_14230 [Gammaproteobacteria bacterium]|nr:hypothetical protein [Gammaproteobacteria bacterium]MDH3537036.1 hypothetical protein [Gammaproteobacteria bacterium]
MNASFRVIAFSVLDHAVKPLEDSFESQVARPCHPAMRYSHPAMRYSHPAMRYSHPAMRYSHPAA